MEYKIISSLEITEPVFFDIKHYVEKNKKAKLVADKTEKYLAVIDVSDNSVFEDLWLTGRFILSHIMGVSLRYVGGVLNDFYKEGFVCLIRGNILNIIDDLRRGGVYILDGWDETECYVNISYNPLDFMKFYNLYYTGTSNRGVYEFSFNS